MSKLLQRFLVLNIALFLTACSRTLPERELMVPVPEKYTPEPINQRQEFIEQPERLWWQGFASPELDTLMETLLATNPDLQSARLRVAQSRALVEAQYAKHYPEISAGLGVHRNSNDRSVQSTNKQISLTLSAAYEIDLWGTRAMQSHAEGLNLLIANTRLRSAQLSLQAQLASQYFQTLALQSRIEQTQESILATDSLLQLVKLRQKHGRATEIELKQQQGLLFQQKGQLLRLHRDQKLARHALAVLLGKQADSDITPSGHLEKIVIPKVKLVQPAALLRTRPDIRLAEAQLRVEDAKAFEAHTRRWPTLRLSAEAAFSDLSQSRSPFSTALIGNLMAPIFNAGRLSQQAKAADIAASAVLKKYQQVVGKAFQEVGDALTQLHYQRQAFELYKQEVINADRLYELTKTRYRLGSVGFTELLNAQNTWLSVRDRGNLAKQDYLIATVNTFAALGVEPHSFNPKSQLSQVSNKTVIPKKHKNVW